MRASSSPSLISSIYRSASNSTSPPQHLPAMSNRSDISRPTTEIRDFVREILSTPGNRPQHTSDLIRALDLAVTTAAVRSASGLKKFAVDDLFVFETLQRYVSGQPQVSARQEEIEELVTQSGASNGSQEIIDVFPFQDHIAEMGKRLMTAIRFLTQSQPETPKGIMAAGLSRTFVRNCIVVGIPTMAFPFISAALNDAMATEDPEAQRAKIAWLVSLLPQFFLGGLGMIRELNNGTWSASSLAVRSTAFLANVLGAALAQRTGNLQDLAPNMVSGAACAILGCILGNTILLGPAASSSQYGEASGSDATSMTEEATLDGLFNVGVTALSDTIAFWDKTARAVDEHGYTLLENSMPNTALSIAADTMKSVGLQIRNYRDAGTVEPLALSVAFPGWAGWYDMASSEFPIDMMTTQNSGTWGALAVYYVNAPVAKTIVSALSSGVLSASAVIVERIASTPTNARPSNPGVSGPDDNNNTDVNTGSDATSAPTENAPLLSTRMTSYGTLSSETYHSAAFRDRSDLRSRSPVSSDDVVIDIDSTDEGTPLLPAGKIEIEDELPFLNGSLLRHWLYRQ